MGIGFQSKPYPYVGASVQIYPTSSVSSNSSMMNSATPLNTQPTLPNNSFNRNVFYRRSFDPKLNRTNSYCIGDVVNYSWDDSTNKNYEGQPFMTAPVSAVPQAATKTPGKRINSINQLFHPLKEKNLSPIKSLKNSQNKNENTSKRNYLTSHQIISPMEVIDEVDQSRNVNSRKNFHNYEEGNFVKRKFNLVMQQYRLDRHNRHRKNRADQNVQSNLRKASSENYLYSSSIINPNNNSRKQSFFRSTRQLTKNRTISNKIIRTNNNISIDESPSSIFNENYLGSTPSSRKTSRSFLNTFFRRSTKGRKSFAGYANQSNNEYNSVHGKCEKSENFYSVTDVRYNTTKNTMLDEEEIG
ncbi:hypothetical protein SNEBB_005181 [Seison nebaliae]|nr:hypothetical protein SNEBB_005181 [Seison nebaliae]